MRWYGFEIGSLPLPGDGDPRRPAEFIYRAIRRSGVPWRLWRTAGVPRAPTSESVRDVRDSRSVVTLN
jgi:hypothetical protein